MVNLEALRRHLVDMHNFTLDIDIVSQTPIAHGVEILLAPHNARVAQSLDRAFVAHPAQLKRETGWEMTTTKLNNGQ